MKAVYNVAYSPKAYDDLTAIYTYISTELKSKNNAQAQVDRIRDAIRKLDVMPERHERVDWEPWLSMGMRKMPIDNYIIFYLVDSSNMIVVIDRIVYGGRNLEEIL